MKKIINCSIVASWIAVFWAVVPVFAQAPGLPGGPSQVPVTGGLAFLAVGGGIYAVKKLRGLSK